jgi:hypothetical protein
VWAATRIRHWPQLKSVRFRYVLLLSKYCSQIRCWSLLQILWIIRLHSTLVNDNLILPILKTLHVAPLSHTLHEMVDIFYMCILIELPLAPSNNSPVVILTASSPRTAPYTPPQPWRRSSRGLWSVFKVIQSEPRVFWRWVWVEIVKIGL